MITRAQPYVPDKADWAQAGLLALILFALYALTAPRTVALEDDGLFVLANLGDGFDQVAVEGKGAPRQVQMSIDDSSHGSYLR